MQLVSSGECRGRIGSSGWVSQETWISKGCGFYTKLEAKWSGSCFGQEEDINTIFETKNIFFIHLRNQA